MVYDVRLGRADCAGAVGTKCGYFIGTDVTGTQRAAMAEWPGGRSIHDRGIGGIWGNVSGNM